MEQQPGNKVWWFLLNWDSQVEQISSNFAKIKFVDKDRSKLFKRNQIAVKGDSIVEIYFLINIFWFLKVKIEDCII